MDADAINDITDDIYNASEDVVQNILIDKALLAVLGVSTGFFARLLTIIIKKVLDVTAFKLLRMLKREGQMVVDVIEGDIICRRVDQAVEDNDEEAFISAISDY